MHIAKLGVGVFVVAGLLSGCNKDSTSSGSLSLALTDAPVDNVAEVHIQFTGITLKREGAQPEDIVFDQPKDIDLAQLTGGNSTALLDGHPVEAGAYQWVRLNVNAALDGTFDSYVMTTTGQMIELEVTSQRGLQLSSGFTVTQNQDSSFIIDWDLAKGLTAPANPNQDGWMLRPSLRITDQTQYGSISGQVDETLLTASNCTNDLGADTGNSVYIYEGADVTPDDIDQGAVDPLTTGVVKQDINGFYTYKVTYLSPGDYTVAYTCQASDDDPEVDDPIVFGTPSNATVTDGQDTVVDFQ